jgi:PAS domain S-box-containing protein
MAADRSRFQDLLEAAPDAIIEVDRSGAIALVNRAAESLFGYSRAELLALKVDNLLPEALRGAHEHHRAAYWNNPSTRPMGLGMVLSARRRDGSTIPVEISLSPVTTDDGFRVTAIIRDVTERRAAERLKSEFLASVSHELRTPLHTIIGFTELLAEELEGPLNDKQKRFVEHVRKDSVHLLELINDILDLSKIEAGRLELDIRPVDAAVTLDDTLAGIRPSAEAKGIAIESQVAGSVPVMADPVRLREIFTNLLTNAIKFTPARGSITIGCSGAESRAHVRFFVRDTGIGIAPEDHAAIFERFRQVAPTTRGVREGTGLGLAIVKHLIEMHHGAIEVESQPGKGSCFSFTLPADPGRAASAPVVLIVENEPAARDLIASYLNPLGIVTEFAPNPDGAAAFARELQPAAITLDLLMPGRSGWRVLSELRSLPETCAIPVFVISVLDRDSEALALGATEYLQKPVRRNTLLNALTGHVPAIRAALAK